MEFTREEVSELASKFSLIPEGDGRKIDSYINALARSPVDFTKILKSAYLEDLRFACGQLGLDATGTKALLAARLIGHFEGTSEPTVEDADIKKVFIGHGRSDVWMKLKDLVEERLHLRVDEFNREPAAGLTTVDRLQRMLNDACFALLVMTADDEHADGSRHARENVVHEAGLFQGRLGFHKAIILLEDGCAEFSNMVGLTSIRFPKGDVLAKSEELRRVFEREGLVKPHR